MGEATVPRIRRELLITGVQVAVGFICNRAADPPPDILDFLDT